MLGWWHVQPLMSALKILLGDTWNWKQFTIPMCTHSNDLKSRPSSNLWLLRSMNNANSFTRPPLISRNVCTLNLIPLEFCWFHIFHMWFNISRMWKYRQGAMICDSCWTLADASKASIQKSSRSHSWSILIWFSSINHTDRIKWCTCTVTKKCSDFQLPAIV